MQAKLIRNVEGRNPDFDRRQPESETNRRRRQIPEGTVIDHPQAWALCVPDARGIVKAEPADDECAAKVATALQRRQKVLDRLTADERAKRAKLADKLPTLNEDGSNGPSPASQQAAKKRRRKSGQ